MAHQWYYQLLNEEFGPVSEDEIRDLVAVGTLSDSDLVRREGLSRWEPLAAMQSIATAGTSDSEPSDLGDLSELSFSFEEATAPPEIADDASLLQMSEIQFEDESTRPVPPPKSRIPETLDTASSADAWYCESAGDVLGPMPLQTLIRMADRGMVSEADRVRQGDSAPWVSCSEIPELAAAFLSSSLSISSGQPVADTPSSTSVEPSSPAGRPGRADKSRRESRPPARDNSSKPRPATRRKAAGAGSTRVASPRKTRQAAAREEVPDDLFDEVFSDDSTASRRSSNAAAAPVLQPANDLPEPDAGPVATDSAPVTSAPSAMRSAVMAAAEKSAPQPAKEKKPRRELSMPSFNMPEPKTLGMIGGGLAVVLLLVGFFTGTISLSMLGFAPNPASALTRFSNEYKSMSGSSISSADWKSFGDRVRPVVRQIQDSIIAKESRTSDDERYGKASGVLLRLVNLRAADKEKQAEVFAEMQEILGGG